MGFRYLVSSSSTDSSLVLNFSKRLIELAPGLGVTRLGLCIPSQIVEDELVPEMMKYLTPSCLQSKLIIP